jgi:hypothetical protein
VEISLEQTCRLNSTKLEILENTPLKIPAYFLGGTKRFPQRTNCKTHNAESAYMLYLIGAITKVFTWNASIHVYTQLQFV